MTTVIDICFCFMLYLTLACVQKQQYSAMQWEFKNEHGPETLLSIGLAPLQATKLSLFTPSEDVVLYLNNYVFLDLFFYLLPACHTLQYSKSRVIALALA